jgi:hypothetical protein
LPLCSSTPPTTRTAFNAAPSVIHAAAVTIHVAAAALTHAVVELVHTTTPPLSTAAPFPSRTTHSLLLPYASNVPAIPLPLEAPYLPHSVRTYPLFSPLYLPLNPFTCIKVHFCMSITLNLISLPSFSMSEH